MKKFLSIILFIFTFNTLVISQFGVRAKYNMNNHTTWTNFLSEEIPSFREEVIPTNLEFGIDYWFRLKNQRIEFMPELFYGLKKSTQLLNNEVEISSSYLGFAFNTNIYAFDFTGDCDCPTFSKQGPSLQKGFFFSLAPSVVRFTRNVEFSNSSTENTTSNTFNLRLGVGAGYDIGINDLITITPQLMYHYSPSNDWVDLTRINGPELEELQSSVSQLQFQIRIGFRPDYLNRYGRR